MSFAGWETWLLIGLIVGLGQFVYAAVGFGAALVSISLLGLFLGGISDFVPLFLLLCLPVELFVTLKDHKQIQFSRSWPLLVCSLPFMIWGSYLLGRVADANLLMIMGAVVALLALYYFWNPVCKAPWVRSFPFVFLVGGMSGTLGSLFGMSGPPVIFFFKSLGLNKTEFRVSLTSLFLAMGICRMLIYSSMGFYTVPILKTAITIFPFSLAGLYFGSRLHYRLSEQVFRVITSLLLFMVGILMLVKNL